VCVYVCVCVCVCVCVWVCVAVVQCVRLTEPTRDDSLTRPGVAITVDKIKRFLRMNRIRDADKLIREVSNRLKEEQQERADRMAEDVRMHIHTYALCWYSANVWCRQVEAWLWIIALFSLEAP